MLRGKQSRCKKIGIRLVSGVCIATAMTFAAESRGQETTGKPESAPMLSVVEIAPEAEQLIARVGEFYKSLRNLSVDISLKVTLCSGDFKHEISTSHAIAMQRPNLFAAIAKSDESGFSILVDGKKTLIYSPTENAYVEAPALEDLDAMPGSSVMGVASLGVLFLEHLITSDPKEALLRDVIKAQYSGIEEVDGVKLHRLTLEEEDITWTVWIDAGEQPVVRRVAPFVKQLVDRLRQDKPSDEEPTMEAAIVYIDWKLNTELDSARFAFAPPSTARKIDQNEVPSSAAMKLEGQPAPELKLSLLDGGSIDLAQHKGKDIVILDFWATWCPPCRKGLPVLSAVAEDYKDKGVALYAVNMQETPEEIRAFLKEANLKTNVLLDPDGEVATRFRIGPLPTTFMIARDGTVGLVHEGIPRSGYEEAIKHDLDMLLAKDKK